jgi:hypothetical protein
MAAEPAWRQFDVLMIARYRREGETLGMEITYNPGSLCFAFLRSASSFLADRTGTDRSLHHRHDASFQGVGQIGPGSAHTPASSGSSSTRPSSCLIAHPQFRVFAVDKKPRGAVTSSTTYRIASRSARTDRASGVSPGARVRACGRGSGAGRAASRVDQACPDRDGGHSSTESLICAPRTVA